MKKNLILVLLALLCLNFTGCALFKEPRRDIPPPPPRLNYKQDESIKRAAKVNEELAKWILNNGVKPGDERAIILSNGTRVILKYTGDPYEDVDATDLKGDKKIIDKASDVAIDWQKANGKYDDTLNTKRESMIHDTNLKWAWGRIIGFFTSSWVLVGLGLVVASIFFPVLLPVLSLFWQLTKAGWGAFKVVSALGVKGITALIGSIEKFREEHKGTPTGDALDKHLSATLPPDVKTNIDSFKNNFNI